MSAQVTRISKLAAAHRQLATAIRLHFEVADPVAVHTLVGAASTILSDLVEKKHPDRSWDRFAQDANKIDPSTYFRVMRAGQNFLKHARDDPDGEFDLNAAETEDLLFFATMNAGEVDAISDAESVFQFWYLAVRSVNLPGDFPFVREALEYFSGIIAMTPGEQRTFGATRLAEELKGDA